jgi:hypothetical protein
MNTRIRTLLAAATFAVALTSLPATSLAYSSVSTPVTSTTQPTPNDSNPLRSLVNVFAQQAASLWSALDGLYSDQYVATDCDPSC